METLGSSTSGVLRKNSRLHQDVQTVYFLNYELNDSPESESSIPSPPPFLSPTAPDLNASNPCCPSNNPPERNPISPAKKLPHDPAPRISHFQIPIHHPDPLHPQRGDRRPLPAPASQVLHNGLLFPLGGHSTPNPSSKGPSASSPPGQPEGKESGRAGTRKMGINGFPSGPGGVGEQCDALITTTTTSTAAADGDGSALRNCPSRGQDWRGRLMDEYRKAKAGGEPGTPLTAPSSHTSMISP